MMGGVELRERPELLAHRKADSVAVAVQDVGPGRAVVAFLDSDQRTELTVGEAVPLGHKVALVPMAKGDAVTEYGVTIGLALSAIAPGAHVHVHNIGSARWPRRN